MKIEKKLLLILMFMYLASGCTAATKIEKLPMEDNGRIIVEVENEDYALKLKRVMEQKISK